MNQKLIMFMIFGMLIGAGGLYAYEQGYLDFSQLAITGNNVNKVSDATDRFTSFSNWITQYGKATKVSVPVVYSNLVALQYNNYVTIANAIPCDLNDIRNVGDNNYYFIGGHVNLMRYVESRGTPLNYYRIYNQISNNKNGFYTWYVWCSRNNQMQFISSSMNGVRDYYRVGV